MRISQPYRVIRALHRQNTLSGRSQYLAKKAHPNLDLRTGELLPEQEHPLIKFTLGQLFGRKLTPAERERPAGFGRTTLKPFAAFAFALCFIIFLGSVILIGFLVNGSSVAPYYKGELDTYFPPDYVQDYYGRK